MQAYDRIAGYSPASLVTDYNALDLDQEDITYYLEGPNRGDHPFFMDPDWTPDYSIVYNIYDKGGNSESQATVVLPSSSHGIEKGDTVTGASLGGASGASGSATQTGTVTNVAGSTLKIEYTVPQAQEDAHAFCRVGGLPPAKQITDGCFDPSQPLTFSGGQSITPTSITNSPAGRTLREFSTTAGTKMRTGCSNCPMPVFQEFYDFYGNDDYGDKYVLGVLGTPGNGYEPGSAGTARHNSDFSDLLGKSDHKARYELIEKFIMHLNVWMYAYRMLNAAYGQCTPNCIACNDGAVRTWDGAVAFYTGSLEGERGGLERGVFPHNQADKRCSNFKTCGPEGDSASGTAKANHEMFRLMSSGQSNLLMGACEELPPIISQIVSQMTIPFIQGTLRYAEISSRTGAQAPENLDKAQAEGVAFAALAAPRIAACPNGGAEDAEIIWSNMAYGASVPDYVAVKQAFERHYSCLNITCKDIGGMWKNGAYLANSDPCVDPDPKGALLSNEAIVGVIIGAGAAVCMCILACCCIMRLIQEEKKGKPIFTSLDNPSVRPGGTQA